MYPRSMSRRSGEEVVIAVEIYERRAASAHSGQPAARAVKFRLIPFF